MPRRLRQLKCPSHGAGDIRIVRHIGEVHEPHCGRGWGWRSELEVSLVLPTPPGPASVTSRAAESARRSVASSRSRPTSGVTGTGGAAGREGRYERGVLRQHGGLDRAQLGLGSPDLIDEVAASPRARFERLRLPASGVECLDRSTRNRSRSGCSSTSALISPIIRNQALRRYPESGGTPVRRDAPPPIGWRSPALQGWSAHSSRADPRQSASASPYRRAWTRSSNRNASTEFAERRPVTSVTVEIPWIPSCRRRSRT